MGYSVQLIYGTRREFTNGEGKIDSRPVGINGKSQAHSCEIDLEPEEQNRSFSGDHDSQISRTSKPLRRT